ncbi:basic region leucine zipper domain-containing protein [Ditylenchus destructor]|nr:basic region leucine zipper domain-containing protein [Ditylenchus destructor]
MDCAERPASARSPGPSRNNHPPFNSLGILNKPVRLPVDETDISIPHGAVIRNSRLEQCRNFSDKTDISDTHGNSSPDAQNQNAPPLLHSCITMISPSQANQRLAHQFIFHDAASKQNGNYSYSGSSVTSSNYSDISLSPNSDETKTSSHRDSQAEGSTTTQRDDNNWESRKRNTDATRKSREKKRFSDMAMEQRLVELTKENNLLKNKLEMQHKANSQAESVIVAGPSVLMSSGLPFPTLDAAALNPLSLGSTAIDEDSCNNTNFDCAETKDSSTTNDTPPKRESNEDINKVSTTPNSPQKNLNSEQSPMDLSNASPKYVPPFSVLMPRYLASDSFPLPPITLDPSNEQEKPCTSMGTPFSLSNLHTALQQHAALMAMNNQNYRPPFGSLLSSLPPHTSAFLHHPLTAGMPLMHPGSSGVLSGSHPSAFQPFTALSVSSSKSDGDGDSSNIERPAVLRMNMSSGRGSALGENNGNQNSAPDSSSDKIVDQPLAIASIDRSSTLLAPQPVNSLRPSVLSHIPASKTSDPPNVLLPNLAPLLSNPHYTHPQSQLPYISRPSIFSNGGPSNIQTAANGNQSRHHGHMPSLGSVLMMNHHATSDHLGQSSSKFVPNFLPPNGSGFNFATDSGHHVRSRSIAGSSMVQNNFPGVSEHNQQPHSLLGTLLSAARRSPSVPESRTEKQSGLVELKDEKHKQSSGNLSPTKSESDRRNKSETCKRRHSCHTGEESSTLAINLQTSTNTASASTSSYMNVGSGKSDSDEIHSLGSPNSTDSNRSRASSLTTACATNGDHHTSLGRTTGSSSATNSLNGDLSGIRRSSSPSNASVDDMGQHHFNTSASTSSASPPSGGTMNIHGSGLTNEQCGIGQNTMRPDLERYMDRRRRNNEAAKRCRANRRAVFEYRSRRAQLLEIENGELRQEMLKLHNELEQLKAIIAANGRILQPTAS